MQRPDVEDSIMDLLEENDRLSFGDLQARSEYSGNSVREAFKYLLEEGEIHVEGLESGQKMYEKR